MQSGSWSFPHLPKVSRLVSPHHTAHVDKIQQVPYDHLGPVGCPGWLLHEEVRVAAVEGILSALERNWEMVDATLALPLSAGEGFEREVRGPWVPSRIQDGYRRL
jgi:hypothetical protein